MREIDYLVTPFKHQFTANLRRAHKFWNDTVRDVIGIAIDVGETKHTIIF